MSSGLDAWIGKRHEATEVITSASARALAATLDRDPAALGDGRQLPAGWHWIYFNSLPPRSALADDGHATRGSFLPPVEHPHRMWAGGRLSFSNPLVIGETATRVSTIEAIDEKEGRSGPLTFVTIRHELFTGGALAVDEEMQLVYLSRRGPAPARRSPESEARIDPDWRETFVADEVTLFRFSALTLNSHRIHYDLRYATDVEGYPGLVVHGPLVALLLLDAGVRHAEEGESPTSFRYRARSPLFCREEFGLEGRRTDTLALAATHPERGVATEAELELSGRSSGSP